jgi:hypothetical protein
MQKLLDEVGAVGPDNLSDAHLFCAGSGPGDGEVHEIDAGDKENKKRDGCKNINILDVTVALDFELFIGMQMDAG